MKDIRTLGLSIALAALLIGCVPFDDDDDNPFEPVEQCPAYCEGGCLEDDYDFDWCTKDMPPTACGCYQSDEN